MALNGKTDHEKLASLCAKTYKEQAVWFLTAFWNDFQGEAENVWGFVKKCAQLDLQKRDEGNALDEAFAHKFLETIGETKTVLALREELRKTGAIGTTERPKVVPLTHYLLNRYGVNWHTLVNTQGDNSAELIKAQKLLDEVSAAFAESDKQAAAARLAEAPFKAAQEEVEAAYADVKSQEDARSKKIEELEKKSQEGGPVQQNKAKAELAQVKAEDPLPLRKAKITLEAALKKAEKARAPFEAATRVAEEALEASRKKLEEAEAYLHEVKSKPGSPLGTFWWMERELQEKRAYLPTSKGGIGKKLNIE
eukprot:TRINITY_DN7272_c0_g1_i1.p1 TRINITY_DN7272_c0_g1~~TRINITY_DN7272_c0_g1_i1.p1  ORF type:complete len:309 (-),score=93.35 TRINITY_DN7272_c0_g1_i1:22-948(-)